MEKETFDFIGGILVMIMVISGMGIGFYGLHVMSSTKKKERDASRFKLPANVKFTSYNNPFEKLWKEAGCYSLDMDGCGQFNLMDNSIRNAFGLPPKHNDEEVYYKALLELIKDGMSYRRMKANDPELRKFCIINTCNSTTIENRIKNADILYEYINNGCQVKNKEV